MAGGGKQNTDLKGVETAQLSWASIGTILASTAHGDSVLDVDERDFTTANALTNTVTYTVPPEVNYIEIRFILTTDEADVDIDIWAVRSADGEMCRVCTLGVVCGQQDADDVTHHYADTCTIADNKWLTTVSEIAPGTNHMARIMFDVCGYDRILFHGFGTFDENCEIECTGY